MPHPFANAYRCDQADVEEVVPSAEHPDGLNFRTPCLCPSFLTLMHDTQEPGPLDNQGRPTMVTVRTKITGCFQRLYPWMQGGAIIQMNKVLADVGAHRKDTQMLTQAVVTAVVGAPVLTLPSEGRLPMLPAGDDAINHDC